MVDIITVHGTFAGDEDDKGEKWWQKGSPFVTKLQACVKEPLKINPFHWSGANSEMDRRDAGLKLFRDIKNSDEPPIVIGHSHGGSTSIHALAAAVIKRPSKAREMVRGFISIGTPMFRFRSNYNPFTRFNFLGRLFLLLALIVLLMGVTNNLGAADEVFSFAQGLRELTGLGGDFRTGFGFWLSVVILFLLYRYTRLSSNRIKLFKSNKLREVFNGKYTSLTHTRDEAVRALTRGAQVSPKLVRFPAVLVGVFSTISFTLLAADFSSEFTNASLNGRDFFFDEDRNKPKTFVTGALPGEAIKFTDQTDQLSLFDQVGARRVYTRTSLSVFSLDSLWTLPGVSEAITTPAQQDAFAPLHSSVPFGDGVFMVTEQNQPYIEAQFVDAVRHWADQVAAAAPGSTPNVPQDYATFFGAFPREGDRWAIISLLPATGFSYSVVGNQIAPDTEILLSQDASVLYDEQCALLQNNADTSICRHFYRKGNNPIRQVVYNGRDLKHRIADVLPFETDLDAATDLDLGGGGITLPGILFGLAISGVFSAIIALILTPMLSAFLTNTLRGQAFGNDGFGESLTDVKPGLDFADDKIGTLPQAVQDEMDQNARHDAPDAIERLRNLLAETDLISDTGADPIAMATKFDKSELIHNAYFHSDQFIKYVGALLVEQYGLTPSAAFDADADAQSYRQMIRDTGALRRD